MDSSLIVGLFIGCIINAIWYYFNWYIEPRKYKISGKYRWGWICIFEHYHWSTILLILGLRLDTPILTGIGIVLLLDEGIAQSHKFALGSGHFIESLLVEIVIILVWLFAELINVII